VTERGRSKMVRGGDELPRFGRDLGRVSGYTTDDQEVAARVFAPLRIAGDSYVSWGSVADACGLALDGNLRWSELRRHLGGSSRLWPRPQAGTLDLDTIIRLMTVLAESTQVTDCTRFVLWEGYGGELLTGTPPGSVPISRSGGTFLQHMGACRLTVTELRWAETRSDEAGFRFPVAIWPADKSFVLAMPIYHDSIWLSCSRDTYAALEASGLEIAELSRHVPLPSEGD